MKIFTRFKPPAAFSGIMTTRVVRLKGAEERDCGALVEKQQIFIKHGFKVCSIRTFPGSLQPSVYPPE